MPHRRPPARHPLTKGYSEHYLGGTHETASRPARMTLAPLPPDEFEALEGLARTLTSSGWYRVARRFQPRRCYDKANGRAIRTALYVDVETTGLGDDDRIIEFAALPFTYAVQTGEICDVGEGYCGFEDPGRPIPEAVTALTGITDDMVRGRQLDDAAVTALLGSASLVIAHNASFDRPHVERRFPRFADRPWACSYQDVPWSAHGCRSAKLEYLLLTTFGEFFAGHRALEDCQVGVHVLASRLPTGALPMAMLLEGARASTVRVWATGAPIGVKDVLKSRGYSWHPGDQARAKAWYRDVPEPDVESECAWLAEVAYTGRSPGHELTTMTALTRYSRRPVA